MARAMPPSVFYWSSMKIAFDIGGVLSKFPDQFRHLALLAISGSWEVFVITDMHDRASVLKMLGRMVSVSFQQITSGVQTMKERESSAKLFS
jgi:hypothetical protein